MVAFPKAVVLSFTTPQVHIRHNKLEPTSTCDKIKTSGTIYIVHHKVARGQHNNLNQVAKDCMICI